MTEGDRIRKPGAFLDLDGVLNKNNPNIHPPELNWIEGAREAVRQLNSADFFVFVVSNQGGIAHGLYTEQDVLALQTRIVRELAAIGGRIDGFRYCPYDTAGTIPAYTKKSDWRKPAPGMIFDL